MSEYERRRQDPALKELLGMVREDGINGIFAVPASTEFVGSLVVVNGHDEENWRTERLVAIDLEGEEPVGIVPQEDQPTWDILPLSSFWLIDKVIESMVTAREERIIGSLEDQISDN